MKVKRTQTHRERITVEYSHEDIEKILEEHVRRNHVPCSANLNDVSVAVSLEGGDALCRATVVVDVVEVEDG